jgi:ATP-dependent exoDNAse (exonuclease V) beta subunit
MQLLSEKHNHPKDKYISLDELTHIYTINNKSDFISVTTFVHSLFNNFNADKVIDNIIRGKNYKKSKYYNLTREEIKNMWETNRKDAAEKGTKIHLDIENYYNNIIVNNNSVEYLYFKNFLKDNDLKPYRSEWKVWDEEYKITGTIDMVYENKDGTLMIYDWKRSKEIMRNRPFEKYSKIECISHIPDLNFWHYSLQLNIYKRILETKYNKKISKMCLVCLYPENDNYIIYEVPELCEEINDLFQILLKNK